MRDQRRVSSQVAKNRVIYTVSLRIYIASELRTPPGLPPFPIEHKRHDSKRACYTRDQRPSSGNRQQLEHKCSDPRRCSSAHRLTNRVRGMLRALFNTYTGGKREPVRLGPTATVNVSITYRHTCVRLRSIFNAVRLRPALPEILQHGGLHISHLCPSSPGPGRSGMCSTSDTENHLLILSSPDLYRCRVPRLPYLMTAIRLWCQKRSYRSLQERVARARVSSTLGPERLRNFVGTGDLATELATRGCLGSWPKCQESHACRASPSENTSGAEPLVNQRTNLSGTPRSNKHERSSMYVCTSCTSCNNCKRSSLAPWQSKRQ